LQQFLPCPILKGTLQAASSTKQHWGSQHTSLDQILCFIHMASMPKKKHNAPFLQKYHKTDLMDSKGIASFPLDTRPAWLQASTCMWPLEENPIWIPILSCYICWKNFLPWYSYISAQPCDTSQALHSIKTHGYQTPVPLQPASFPAHTSSMCLMQQRQQSQANVDTNKHPHRLRARNANIMRHF
jgi:hypothetical protein